LTQFRKTVGVGSEVTVDPYFWQPGFDLHCHTFSAKLLLVHVLQVGTDRPLPTHLSVNADNSRPYNMCPLTEFEGRLPVSLQRGCEPLIFLWDFDSDSEVRKFRTPA